MSGDVTEQSRLLDEADVAQNGTNKHHKAIPSNSGKLEGRELYLALAFPYLGTLLAAIDVTMTSTVAATIASDFSSLSIVSWLGSAYLVALAAVQPLSGKLTDRYGRRAGLLLSLICFAVGNLMCGVATSTAMIVAGRVVAGAGGGGMCSITTFVTTDLVPLRKRSLWQGSGDVLWALGMGLGGIVGGGINDLYGWRWAFIVLTPLTLLVAVGTFFTLKLPSVHHHHIEDLKSPQIDVAGASTLTVAVVTLILGLNITEKGSEMVWSSVLMGIALVSLVIFIIIEVRFASDPIIPVQLLADYSVAGTCLSGLLVSASMHTLLFYVPLVIQVRGFSTTEVGLQLLGEPLGASTGSPLTGLVMRIVGGYAVVKPVVFLVYLAAPLGYTLSTLDTPIWATVTTLVAMGAGYGSFLTVIVTGLLATTEHRMQATTTGMLYAFRQVGASTGLALSGILFRVRVAQELNGTISNQITSKDNIADQCNRHSFTSGNRPMVCVAYGNALHTVFLFTLILGAAGVVCGMFMRNEPLDRDDTVIPEPIENGNATNGTA